jgi:hypothetical protein
MIRLFVVTTDSWIFHDAVSKIRNVERDGNTIKNGTCGVGLRKDLEASGGCFSEVLYHLPRKTKKSHEQPQDQW